MEILCFHNGAYNDPRYVVLCDLQFSYAYLTQSEYIYQVKWNFFLKTERTSIICIFKNQNMFIKLQLLMSLSMNQFICQLTCDPVSYHL